MAEARAVATRHRIVAIFGLALAVAGTALPQTMTAPVITVTADAFHTTPAEAGWAMTLVLVVAAVSAPVAGRAADAFGARRVLRLLLPVAAVGLAMTALATSLPWLLTGRVLVGVGGGAFPLAIVAARRVTASDDRSWVVSLLATISAASVGLGAVVSGLLTDAFGLRALSWVPLAMIAAAWIMLLWALPPIPTGARERMELRAAAALVVGVVALMLAVTEAPRWPLAPAAIALCLAVAAAALSYWLLRERRSTRPLLGVWRGMSPTIAAAHVCALLLGAALLSTFVLLPAFAESAADDGVGLSASVTAAALLLVPSTLAMIAVAPLATVLRRTVGTRAPVLIGAPLAAGGTVVMTVAPHTALWLLVGAAILGAGAALALAGIVNILVDAVPAERVGAVTGINVTARQFGGALAVATATAMLTGAADEASGFALGFGFSAACAVLATVAALALPWTRHR